MQGRISLCNLENLAQPQRHGAHQQEEKQEDNDPEEGVAGHLPCMPPQVHCSTVGSDILWSHVQDDDMRCMRCRHSTAAFS